MRCFHQFVRQTAAVLLVLALAAPARHADLVVNVPNVTVFSGRQPDQRRVGSVPDPYGRGSNDAADDRVV